MKVNDIEKIKKEGYEKRFEFEDDRNVLEDKFHVIYHIRFNYLFRKFSKKI